MQKSANKILALINIGPGDLLRSDIPNTNWRTWCVLAYVPVSLTTQLTR